MSWPTGGDLPGLVRASARPRISPRAAHGRPHGRGEAHRRHGTRPGRGAADCAGPAVRGRRFGWQFDPPRKQNRPRTRSSAGHRVARHLRRGSGPSGWGHREKLRPPPAFRSQCTAGILSSAGERARRRAIPWSRLMGRAGRLVPSRARGGTGVFLREIGAPTQAQPPILRGRNCHDRAGRVDSPRLRPSDRQRGRRGRCAPGPRRRRVAGRRASSPGRPHRRSLRC